MSDESHETNIRNAQFKEFLARHHDRLFSKQWAAPWEREHDKYSEIVQHLQTRDRHRQEVENRVVEERADWAMKSRNFTSRHKLARKDNIDALSAKIAIADQVQLARGERVHRDAEFEKWLKKCDEQSTSLYKWYSIGLGEFELEGWEMRVYNTLDRVRYYFGHPGGTHIFRHIEQEPSYLEDMFAAEMYENPYCNHLKINHNDRRYSYSFCGLVPRTVQEYIARFEIVCPKAVQLLDSLLLFNKSCSKSANDNPDSFAGTATSVTPDQLEELFNGWIALAKADATSLTWAQEKARSHHLVLECAYLLESIEGQQEGFMANGMIRLFSVALQLATGTYLVGLINKYAELVGEEGLDEFLLRRNFDSCLLISSNVEENIHDFFKAPGFTVDPLHPSSRFRHLDVQPALDEIDALTCEQDELDPEGSDSLLSDLSGFDSDSHIDHSERSSSGDSANPPAADTSTLAFYHPTDPALPENWDPPYPGYVGGRFRSEADNDANHLEVEVDHNLEEQEDDDQEEEESEQLNASNKRSRAQPTHSVKRARTYSSESYRP
ncbi:hypothetical protein E4U56_000775 [Claviceps arundinis]|uniref:Uncharacterized protein n=1 Tax=Claviceps arundinis TaxID=1623583 RepID=A0A9P7MSU3_9HYPO|nr:hypothetical protein E4U56_000775 [Claviceps arundinis]